MMYRINYIDNQGLNRFKTIHAEMFSEALTIAENEANEAGHGVKWVRGIVRSGL